MRLTATFFTIQAITLFSLLLAGCTVQPGGDMKKELTGLAGPKPATMNDALQGQADQAVAAKDYVRAAQTYKQLSDKEPQNHAYTLALADNLRRAGDNQTALRILDSYIAANPKDATAYETRGLCLISLGSLTDAGKSFEQALTIEPDRWRTLNAVGILFTMKNKLPEAIAYYDEALSHNADSASVLNNKAITLAMDSKYDLAIETFMRTRKTLRVGSPDMQQVDMNMALVYAIAGRLEDAERTASPYLSQPALYNNMGVYAELAKNPELSRSYLNMALNQNPVYYERAWMNLSTVSNDNNTSALKTPSLTTLPVDGQDASKTKQKAKKAPVKKATVKDLSETTGIKLDQIPTPEAAEANPRKPGGLDQ